MKPADRMGRGKLCKRCKSTHLIGPEGNICPTCSVRFCSLCHGGVYHIDPVTKIESKTCSSCGDSSSEDEEFVTTKKTSLMISHAPPTHQYPTRSQRQHQEALAKSQSRKPLQVTSKDGTRVDDSKQNPPKIERSSPFNRKSGNSSRKEVDTVILTGKKRSRPMSSVSSDSELENDPEPNYLLASENKPKASTAKIVEEPVIKRRSAGYEIQIQYKNGTANSNRLKMCAPVQDIDNDVPRDHHKRKSVKMSQNLTI